MQETLTTPIVKFGSKCDISDKFIEKLAKCGMVDKALELLEFRESKDLAKTDGKKRSSLKGIVKLEDAVWAGTARGHEATLILTEGYDHVAMCRY